MGSIVAAIVQKNATVYLGVSEGVLRKRRKRILWSWIAGLGGMIVPTLLLVIIDKIAALTQPEFQAGSAIGEAMPSSVAMLISSLTVVLPLVALIMGFRITSLVSVNYIGDEYIWFKGACEEYLEMLPEWDSE
jgi:Na+/H+ antiporter NhaA